MIPTGNSLSAAAKQQGFAFSLLLVLEILFAAVLDGFDAQVAALSFLLAVLDGVPGFLDYGAFQ